MEDSNILTPMRVAVKTFAFDSFLEQVLTVPSCINPWSGRESWEWSQWGQEYKACWLDLARIFKSIIEMASSLDVSYISWSDTGSTKSMGEGLTWQARISAMEWSTKLLLVAAAVMMIPLLLCWWWIQRFWTQQTSLINPKKSRVVRIMHWFSEMAFKGHQIYIIFCSQDNNDTFVKCTTWYRKTAGYRYLVLLFRHHSSACLHLLSVRTPVDVNQPNRQTLTSIKCYWYCMHTWYYFEWYTVHKILHSKWWSCSILTFYA